MKKLLLGVMALVLLATAIVFGQAKKPVSIMVLKGVHPYYEPSYEGFKKAMAEVAPKINVVDVVEMQLDFARTHHEQGFFGIERERS